MCRPFYRKLKNSQQVRAYRPWIDKLVYSKLHSDWPTPQIGAFDIDLFEAVTGTLRKTRNERD